MNFLIPLILNINRFSSLNIYASLKNDKTDYQTYTSDKGKCTFLSLNIIVNVNLLTKVVFKMDLFDEIAKKKQIYRL